MYLWTQHMGWEPKAVEFYLVGLRRELREPNLHPFYREHVVYARKPM